MGINTAATVSMFHKCGKLWGAVSKLKFELLTQTFLDRLIKMSIFNDWNGSVIFGKLKLHANRLPTVFMPIVIKQWYFCTLSCDSITKE